MSSLDNTGRGGAGGLLISTADPPTRMPDAELPHAPVARSVGPDGLSEGIDMTDGRIHSLNQEPGHTLSSSPPFPRYTDYKDAATGATIGRGPLETNAGLTKVKGQDPSSSTSLPVRPAPAKTVSYPSRYAGSQAVGKGDSGTTEWVHSSAGRKFMAKHQLQLPPTQLLSLECQKRKFNPAFEIQQEGSNAYVCTVTIKNEVVRLRGHYPNIVAAKQSAAHKALKLVQAWPIPRANLYFVAQFTGQISDEAVHTKLRQVLNGRRYTLSILRYPGMSGGFLLLQIPEHEGFPTSIIRLYGGLDSVVFANIKKGDHCNLCAKTNLTPHSRVCCPLWRHSPAPPSKLEASKHEHTFAQRPIKTEKNYYAAAGNNNAAALRNANGFLDKKDQLIRSIQDEVGTTPTSSESQDPRVKAAFLEGVALGARLAVTAPANRTNNERLRSRSPDGRQYRGSDYWAPPAYRARSPLPEIRDRQTFREPMVDRPVEPHQASYGAMDSYRGRRHTPEYYVGQGASHWSNDMYFP